MKSTNGIFHYGWDGRITYINDQYSQRMYHKDGRILVVNSHEEHDEAFAEGFRDKLHLAHKVL
jgi:hypothetical protein